MLTQRSSDDMPPPYTPGRAPPSYIDTESSVSQSSPETGEDVEANQPALPITFPAPAAIDVSARIPHVAPPVTTTHTVYDSSRLPFKFTTVPSRAYVRTATSHTWIDMPEPDLTTQPMVRSSPEIITKPSRPAARRRPTGCCACIASLILVAIVFTVVVLLEKKADSEDSQSAVVTTSPNVTRYTSYTGTNYLFFTCC